MEKREVTIENLRKVGFNTCDDACIIDYIQGLQESVVGKRVLVVEDNEINRLMTSEILKNQGFAVDTAENGAVSVDKVQSILDRGLSDYYSVILMDIEMPVMNGYEAARSIRSICGPELHIPIVAITANDSPEYRQKCADSGADDYLAKPIDIALMLATLVKYV